MQYPLQCTTGLFPKAVDKPDSAVQALACLRSGSWTLRGVPLRGAAKSMASHVKNKSIRCQQDHKRAGTCLTGVYVVLYEKRMPRMPAPATLEKKSNSPGIPCHRENRMNIHDTGKATRSDRHAMPLTPSLPKTGTGGGDDLKANAPRRLASMRQQRVALARSVNYQRHL